MQKASVMGLSNGPGWQPPLISEILYVFRANDSGKSTREKTGL